MPQTTRRFWLRWSLGVGTGLVAIAAIAALVVIPGGPSNGDASPDAADGVSERQAWEARQQKILDVLQSMNQAELLGTSPIKGAEDAPVTLIKFSDFQCPYCAVTAGQMQDFVDRHAGEVRYVYKHLPLTQIHPEALPAAKAAWAAGQQEQFWLFHNGLFSSQDQLGEDLYVELATEIGLDLEQFNRDRNSEAAQAAIDQDIALARELGIRGTPTFLMNGLLIPGGAPPEFFDQALERLQALSPEANLEPSPNSTR